MSTADILENSHRQPDRWRDASPLLPALDEECVKQGIEFVPAALKQKRPKGTREDPRERPSSQGSKSWEPSSSDDDQSDSEDSMSDLYPRQYAKCLT